MARRFGIIIILVLVASAAVIGVFLANDQYRTSSGIAGDPPIVPSDAPQVEADAATYDLKFDGLRSQLTSALKSGGISPESYTEISNGIEELGGQGYDGSKIEELRDLLSQLDVGGQNGVSPGNDSVKGTAQQEAGTGPPTTVLWLYRDGKWSPTGEPPACPDPLVLQAPVDLGLATSILYPGQVRGGDFKPHGGFRTDGADGPVEVTAPIEGYVWRVAKFNDAAGIHYMLDIQNPCGIAYRLGHLGAVPPRLESIFDDFPVRDFGDSRTEEVEPVLVELGETIATDVQQGTGFDWGVYDLRSENEASKDPVFREAHKDEGEQAYHALCWFNYLPADQEAVVRGLPAADGVSGSDSDYC